MPNWVQNRVTVTGTAEQLERFKAAIANTDENLEFDFNRLIPMPAELKDTESGSYSNIGFDAFHGNCESILDYPWVKSEGVTTQEELMAFLDKKDPLYRFHGTKKRDNIANFGFASWHDWSCANWGTKWNAGDVSITSESDTSLMLRFDTAWSFAFPIMTKLVGMFPELHFKGTVDEEGGYFYLDITAEKGELAIEEHEGTRAGGPYDYQEEDEEGQEGE